MSEGLFRKAAIDKVSSPEQLDLLMRVTSPAGWLALVTVGVLIFAAGVWSVFGSITESVEGKGSLFRGERLYDIKATLGGRIEMLDVRPGDPVTVGQTIVRIRQEEASAETREAAAQSVKANTERMNAIPAEIDNANRTVARLRRDVENLKRLREERRRLVSSGTLPGSALDDIDQQINNTSAEADRITATLPRLAAELSQLQAEITSTEAAVRSTSEVRSGEAGQVLKVIKTAGDRVPRDERLVLIERASGPDLPCGGDVHALVYIPASFASKVKKGQPVRVSPIGVDREDHGYILGEVESVASGPASTQDMMEKLKNDQLVTQFQPAGEVAYEARICLKKDPNNKLNPFEWSFAQGPAMEERERPICSVSIEVDQRKPYTYVIPKVRGMLGG